MTDDNKARRSQLAAKVEEIEKLIRTGVKTGSFSLAALLDSAQGQLLEQTIEDTKSTVEKKEREQRDQQNAIAEAVERETKLNEKEKQEYGALLQKEYFTKSDFGTLDHFYSHSWSKLSDEGKTEMSHRIDEGIKRGEFKFEDLPENVRKEESGRSASPRSSKETSGDKSRQEESQNSAPQASVAAAAPSTPVAGDETKGSGSKIAAAESSQALSFDDGASAVRPTDLKPPVTGTKGTSI